MLVLSRLPGESIVIDDHITVQVLEVHGETIKLGITAPDDTPIYRQELYEAIQNENKEAGVGSLEQIHRFSKTMQELSSSGEPSE